MSAFDWVQLILTLFSQQCFPTEHKVGKSGPTVNGTYVWLGEVKRSEVKIISELVWNTCGVTILENRCSTFFPFVVFPMCIAPKCSWTFVYWVYILECISYSTNFKSTAVYRKQTHKSEPKLQPTHFNLIFYDLLNWCSHLHLGLKTVLLLSCFQTKLFIFLSQPPHFSLFLFNPQKATLGIWT